LDISVLFHFIHHIPKTSNVQRPTSYISILTDNQEFYNAKVNGKL
jgi:hypothetical protein